MINVSEQAVQILQSARVDLGPGLTDSELSRIERTHGFRFNPDHRDLLEVCTPRGWRWFDWRAPDDVVAAALRWPVDGVVSGVARGWFWHPAWGPRPPGRALAERVAREQLAAAPALIPVRATAFLPAGPTRRDRPVLSVYGLDIIYAARNLVDFLRYDLQGAAYTAFTLDWDRIPFWSDVAEGVVSQVSVTAGPSRRAGDQPKER